MFRNIISCLLITVLSLLINIVLMNHVHSISYRHQFCMNGYSEETLHYSPLPSLYPDNARDWCIMVRLLRVIDRRPEAMFTLFIDKDVRSKFCFNAIVFTTCLPSFINTRPFYREI